MHAQRQALTLYIQVLYPSASASESEASADSDEAGGNAQTPSNRQVLDRISEAVKNNATPKKGSAAKQAADETPSTKKRKYQEVQVEEEEGFETVEEAPPKSGQKPLARSPAKPRGGQAAKRK